MVSTLNLEEKFNRVRRNFCFYLDIQDHGLARSISRRIQDMGLQQEVFLTSRVTHVVASGVPAAGAACPRAERRADAMLQRVRTQPPPQPAHYVRLTVQKAISLLDKLYDTFFAAPRKAHVRYFTKHFIKIEFLDKVCRPIYKEFDEWPAISLEPDPPKEKEESPYRPLPNLNQPNTAGQKMTRKSRPRIKEREEKEQKAAGYCEMCNSEYADAASHRRSPHHAAFVRDHANFMALDSLISAGADVATFLDKAAAHGERRSLRHVCNGALNGGSPRNGLLHHDRKRNTRCAKRNGDRQYYKVVGVSTKLRSSGGFAKRKDSPPACNGTEPLVVKFRKVRRSELSVLSDEAEQFMFPKRASSSSSTSTDEEESRALSPERSPEPPQPPAERRRLARPLALKEESSEEDSWPEDKRRRKRRPPPVTKRGRRAQARVPTVEKQEEKVPEKPPPPEVPTPEPAPKAQPEVSPLREEPVEKCMKWEDGKLKYTPAVEQLEFAFESVPASEPWFETFRRQDQDRVTVKNIPQYFELYSTAAPKLPYEIGQLPPLKPNCCSLSDLVTTKKEEKPGPSRLYGTRGMKRQRIKKRTAAILALEGHPRKSPREHASTLAILGSAGLVSRRKHADDTKSTASEDTSDSHSLARPEPAAGEAQQASERLQQFLAEVFEDAAEFDMSDDAMEGDAAITTSTNAPDVSSLMSECEDCDLIRDEIRAGATENRGRGRRGKFKKKNRTGWPNKRKQSKRSRTNSSESEPKANGGVDHPSAEPMDDDTTQSTVSEDDANASEHETTVVEKHADESTLTADEIKTEEDKGDATDGDEDKVQLDLKVVVRDDKAKADKEDKRTSRSSASDCEDRELRKKKRALQGLLLQPVVRVARVDAARRLRSARPTRHS